MTGLPATRSCFAREPMDTRSAFATEPPSSPMLLTATIAAHGVLRSPRLLRTAAADWHVGPMLFMALEVSPLIFRGRAVTDPDERRTV